MYRSTRRTGTGVGATRGDIMPVTLPCKAEWNAYVEEHGLRAGLCDECDTYVRLLHRGKHNFLCQGCLDKEQPRTLPARNGTLPTSWAYAHRSNGAEGE